jgi:hypothetical protein
VGQKGRLLRRLVVGERDGAQWQQMGKDLLTFPLARAIIRELDEVLQPQLNPPL